MAWEEEGAAAPTEAGYIPFDDDVVTEEQFKELTSYKLLPKGQSRLKITKVERIPPTEEKPGGDRVSFEVVVPPPGVKAPDTGWPKSSRLFKVYANPTEKQKKSQSIDKEGKSQLIKACGIDFKGGNLYLGLKACEGREVLVVVSHREVDGVTYQDIGQFRPV